MENNENKTCYPKQHNHEITGSTLISGCCEYAHNHRFATVSKIEILFSTDIENPICK